MNKLCEINSDFKKFIQDVKIDFDSKRIHKSEYDEIKSDPEEYIKKNNENVITRISNHRHAVELRAV